MGNFSLTNLAVNMYCPGNAAQLDDAGLPSIMVWIPAFKLSDVLNTDDDSLHPAFIVNGQAIDGFWYSKYQNIVHNDRGYSLPGEDPKAGISFDVSCERSEAKGYGWHLSTAAEWAAIALWCMKNGTLPNGNNKNGKDSGETEYKAIPTSYDSNGEIARVATGTGPLTWSHDRTMSGIWDINGNIWEWQAGIRIVWGELQILANNDAADPDNPQSDMSVCWKAINAADGSLVEPECSIADSDVKTSGSTVKLDYVDSKWTYSTGITSADSQNRGCSFGAVTCTDAISDAAKLLLRALALLPDEGKGDVDHGLDSFYCTNGINERSVIRGGTDAAGTVSGAFCLYASWARTMSSSNVGFRSSYIPNI